MTLDRKRQQSISEIYLQSLNIFLSMETGSEYFKFIGLDLET